MSIAGQEVIAPPVLGLFANENEFRDFLAAHLDLIEPDLTLLKIEYALDNPDGAGGRIDILARDIFGHIVCIEIKRSDNSARGALNELSKYVTLLVDCDRVPKEVVRCILVSTEWHELLLPLSHFAYATGVDVTALHAVAEQGSVLLHPVTLKALRFLPQLSPDMDLIRFDSAEPRQHYVDFISERAKQLPFVRLALLLFERRIDLPPGSPACPMIVCVWRIADGFHDQIEAATGKSIGSGFPYVAPGWEIEADAKDWIGDVPRGELPEYVQGWTHGTPEKLHSLDVNYSLSRVVRVGDWARLDFINDDASLLAAARAVSPLGGSERANRHSYRVIVTPKIASSWSKTVDAFLESIAFEPLWAQAAQNYLKVLDGADISVELHAFDKKHFHYAVHQARAHDDAMLGYFEIICRAGDQVFNGLHGYYSWDGKTCPDDAESTLLATYGDLVGARLAIQSAVDQQRYDVANSLHGFVPVVDWLDETGKIASGPPAYRHSLQDFIEANAAYCAQISATLERMGDLPTDPSA